MNRHVRTVSILGALLGFLGLSIFGVSGCGKREHRTLAPTAPSGALVDRAPDPLAHRFLAGVQGAAPSPGVVAGGFCTYGKD